MESTMDTDTDEEPIGVPPGDTVGYNRRADSTVQPDRADELVQPPEPDGDKQVTTAGKQQPVRTLTNWINDIHGNGGDAVRRRQLADSPISHHNSWERVPTHPTCDPPSGVYDGGGTSRETGAKRTGGDQCDTQTSVFDGGGTSILEIQPKASDGVRKTYIIRVDKLRHINDKLRETRDNMVRDRKLDRQKTEKAEEERQLKLCSAATRSDDSVATE